MRLLSFHLRFSSTKSKKTKPVQLSLTPQQLHSYNTFKSQSLPLNLGKVLPSLATKNTLITSALPYVNNVPHLGNIIGALLSADIIARYKRLKGQNVLFVCGTDEYGTATEVKAKQQHKTPKEICDHYHQVHKGIYNWFNISYNHFGRTSSPVHTQVVQDIFLKCYENGFFVQKQMQQLFCHSCDMFLADRYVVGNCKSCGSFTKADQCDSCNKVFSNPQNQLTEIKCSICSSKPEVKPTTHLFFNFETNPQLKKALNKWLVESNVMEKWSPNARGQTKNWLRENVLKDRCMTRDLKWGIPVPLDKFRNKVFYVWFDAPIGYISITKQLLGQQYEKWWRSSQYQVELLQFMGKDNILFHSILFPSTLISTSLKSNKTDYNLVNKLCVTEYLRYEGGKFSKSQNRGVFGNDCAQTEIDSDVWRYYLLANRPETFDCEFVWQEFAEKNNKELMNSIGNLYNRILKVAKKDFTIIPPLEANSLSEHTPIPPLQNTSLSPPQTTLLLNLKTLFTKYCTSLQNQQIKSACETLLQVSFLLNKYVQQTEFWKNAERKPTIISFLLRVLYVFGNLMEPYLPTTSARVYWLLGMESQYRVNAFQLLNDSFDDYVISCLDKSTGLKQPHVLFTQISEQKIQSLSLKFGRSDKTPQPSIEAQTSLKNKEKHTSEQNKNKPNKREKRKKQQKKEDIPSE